MRILSKTIAIDEHDSMVILNSLAQRLFFVNGELAILETAKLRDLMPSERWQLPSRLQGLSREELAGEIDSWKSLRDHINHVANLCSFVVIDHQEPREKTP